MKNRRALFSAIASMSMVTLVFIACNDDEKSEFPGADKPDTGGGDTGPGFGFDAKDTDKDVTSVSCTPKLPTTFAPTLKAPAHQAACEYAQLSGYYAACLAEDKDGNAKLKSKDCEDWRASAANTTCAHCIETDDNTGPAMIFNDRLYYLSNQAGCIAIKQGSSAEGSCADKWNIAAACRREACKTCLGQEGADFASFQGCQMATLDNTKSGDCITYQKTADTTCSVSGYADAAASTYAGDCFKKSGEATGDAFVRLANISCGK